MVIKRRWEGQCYGTSRGRIFVEVEGEDESSILTGTLHLNDEIVGPVVYSVRGKYDTSGLDLIGRPKSESANAAPLNLFIVTESNTQGKLQGKWNTTSGEAGVFMVFPCNPIKDTNHQIPPQLHTARFDFGAVVVNRDEIISIADEIQKEFKTAKVIVTFIKGNQQSQFLTDFKEQKFNFEPTTFIRLSVQEPESGGIKRFIQVEFGQQVNFVTTEGGDQSWVLGTLENLKNSIRPLERDYVAKFKKYGIIILAFLTPSAIVIFPSIETIWDRTLIMSIIVIIVGMIIVLHNRYLPLHATIYLGKKQEDPLKGTKANIVSWIILATAGFAAIILAAFFQGWFQLP